MSHQESTFLAKYRHGTLGYSWNPDWDSLGGPTSLVGGSPLRNVFPLKVGGRVLSPWLFGAPELDIQSNRPSSLFLYKNLTNLTPRCVSEKVS